MLLNIPLHCEHVSLWFNKKRNGQLIGFAWQTEIWEEGQRNQRDVNESDIKWDSDKSQTIEHNSIKTWVSLSYRS